MGVRLPARRVTVPLAAAAVAGVLVGCGAPRQTGGSGSHAGTAPSSVRPGPTPPAGYESVLGASFVGDRDGWVLTDAGCAEGSNDTCVQVLRSSDGGARWSRVSSLPGRHGPGQDGCSSGCVDQVVFTDDQTGYLWGPSTLLMSTDGGQHWTGEPGGADGLVIAGRTAIRLVSEHGGCGGPCDVRVQTAPVGSSAWATVRLPGEPLDSGTLRLLALPGGRAFLESSQGPAGSLYSVRYFVSADAGRNWVEHPDPCRGAGTAAAGAPMASSQMSAGPADGSLSIVCTSGGATKTVITTSTDGGLTFSGSPPLDATPHGNPLGAIGAVSSQVLLTQGDPAGSGLFRSTNRGRTWRLVAPVSGDGSVNAPVSTDARTGYLISPDSRTLWITHDAGQTWTAHRFA